MYIQWFPGHMTKAVREMQDSLNLVDAVIYVLDSRAINSCNNPLFNKLIQNKKVLYVFNKCDLVESNELTKWCNYFDENGLKYVKAIGTSGDCSQIIKGLKEISKDKIEKYERKGAFTTIRAMVIGVPNSGKSTIINSMAKKAKATTGNKPGVTRGKQWISIDNIDLLDTPGTLWTKFEDQHIAHNLAYIGSIKEDILDPLELSLDFIKDLNKVYPNAIIERYNIKEEGLTELDILNKIAENRGFKVKNNELDIERASKTLLIEFRKGKMGKLMLEKR